MTWTIFCRMGVGESTGRLRNGPGERPGTAVARSNAAMWCLVAASRARAPEDIPQAIQVVTQLFHERIEECGEPGIQRAVAPKLLAPQIVCLGGEDGEARHESPAQRPRFAAELEPIGEDPQEPPQGGHPVEDGAALVGGQIEENCAEDAGPAGPLDVPLGSIETLFQYAEPDLEVGALRFLEQGRRAVHLYCPTFEAPRRATRRNNGTAASSAATQKAIVAGIETS
jgi:hypothetical protein